MSSFAGCVSPLVCASPNLSPTSARAQVPTLIALPLSPLVHSFPPLLLLRVITVNTNHHQATATVICANSCPLLSQFSRLSSVRVCVCVCLSVCFTFVLHPRLFSFAVFLSHSSVIVVCFAVPPPSERVSVSPVSQSHLAAVHVCDLPPVLLPTRMHR